MAELTAPHYGGVIDLNDGNDPRTRIVNLVRAESRVLEIGCGSGTIIGHLARAKQCRALAVEPDARMADEARTQDIEVIQGSIEDRTVRELLAARAPFDAIIFADVLEHLRDPWTILRAARPWLAENGVVLASVPNVAHWSIRLALLAGRWNYTDGYLMDRTHLRWFTQKTLRQLFIETGYRVTDWQVRWAALPGDRVWRRVIPFRTRFYSTLAIRLPGLFGYQFVVRANVT